MIRRLRDLLAHVRAGHRIGCETCARRSTVSISAPEIHLPEPQLKYDPEHDEWTAFDDRQRVAAAGATAGEARRAFHAALLSHTLFITDPDAVAEHRRSGRL